MSVFDIDYNKLIKLLLPVRVRKPRLLAFLGVMVSPVVYLYNNFMANRANNLYEVNHTGQVCRLRAAINDRFDNIHRRIYIVDGDTILPTWMYRRTESKPVYIKTRSEASPVYMYRRSELFTLGYFVVKVPGAVTFDREEMKALINKYKLAGKPYKIEIV